MTQPNRKRSDSPTKTCTEPDCDRPLRARGLCGSHYNRSRYTPEQRHAKVTVPCDWCAKPCIKGAGRDKRYGGLFCSYPCRDAWCNWKAGRDRCLVPESHRAHPKWRDPASLLPVLYVAPVYLPALPPPLRWVCGICVRCGDSYIAEDYTDTARYCSVRCMRRVQRHRYRARKADAYVADVSPSKIYERDGWRCQLCRKKVDRTKTAPHPKAPVVDHVVPLADGGTHEPANVQCAHFLCNSIKGDRGYGQQLALIG